MVFFYDPEGLNLFQTVSMVFENMSDQSLTCGFHLRTPKQAAMNHLLWCILITMHMFYFIYHHLEMRFQKGR